MAEERTTEKDRKRIMEGKQYTLFTSSPPLQKRVLLCIQCNEICILLSARRIAAEGKRKIKTEEEELAGESFWRTFSSIV